MIKTLDLTALQDQISTAWNLLVTPAAETVSILTITDSVAVSRVFAGVAPNDVDVLSADFLRATPLETLPDGAAAAYLGSYLRGLLVGLQDQLDLSWCNDPITRAHTLTVLQSSAFWDSVIRPYLPPPCRQALVNVALALQHYHEALALSAAEAAQIVALAEAAVSDESIDMAQLQPLSTAQNDAVARLFHCVRNTQRASALLLDGANLAQAELAHLVADRLQLVGADLSAGDLRHVRWQACGLRAARLAQVQAADATLQACCLNDAQVDGANFEHACLDDSQAIGASFVDAVLRKTLLNETDLSRANLQRASFVGAEGTGTSFRGADLREADLRHVKLDEADFRGADLRGAQLAGAVLPRADFRGALLDPDQLVGVECVGAWVDAELSAPARDAGDPQLAAWQMWASEWAQQWAHAAEQADSKQGSALLGELFKRAGVSDTLDPSVIENLAPLIAQMLRLQTSSPEALSQTVPEVFAACQAQLATHLPALKAQLSEADWAALQQLLSHLDGLQQAGQAEGAKHASQQSTKQ